MEGFTRDGLRFDVQDAGPRGGPVVVLLHGWPQDHTAWDRVAPLLHRAGLRTLAPDQRGYAPGARPPGRAAYRMAELVGDVEALLDAAGLQRAHLVGHDWGGAVAWAFAARHPSRLTGLTVLSTPHPGALGWALRHSDQALRSWYLLAFQVPALPEAVLRRQLLGLLARSGLPAADAQRYAARFREPGAARGGLAWYRALGLDLGGGVQRVRVPTTLVWGRRDPALGRAAAERTARWVAGDYRFIELDAGHWLPELEAEAVAAAVIARAG
jgi:pimeloyl-ACP methyl ester carboxylesterase